MESVSMAHLQLRISLKMIAKTPSFCLFYLKCSILCNHQEETYMAVFATSIRSILPVYPCFLTWILAKTLLLVFGPQYAHSLCFCWVVLTPMSLDPLLYWENVTPICQQLENSHPCRLKIPLRASTIYCVFCYLSVYI